MDEAGIQSTASVTERPGAGRRRPDDQAYAVARLKGGGVREVLVACESAQAADLFVVDNGLCDYRYRVCPMGFAALTSAPARPRQAG